MNDIKLQQIEALRTAYDYIFKLVEGINEVIEDFEGGHEENAYQMVERILEGYDWLLNVIILTNTLHKQPIMLEEIPSLIEELLEAFENKDSLLIAEILRYEILEHVQVWRDVIKDTLEN